MTLCIRPSRALPNVELLIFGSGRGFVLRETDSELQGPEAESWWLGEGWSQVPCNLKRAVQMDLVGGVASFEGFVRRRNGGRGSDSPDRMLTAGPRDLAGLSGAGAWLQGAGPGPPARQVEDRRASEAPPLEAQGRSFA